MKGRVKEKIKTPVKFAQLLKMSVPVPSARNIFLFLIGILIAILILIVLFFILTKELLI